MLAYFKNWRIVRVLPVVVLAASALSFSNEAEAGRISNPVAVFAGLDKITGRVTSFDVYMNETVQFGALQVTPKVCYSRDDTEAQKIDGFVEVDEITLDRKIRRIFTGWMFADSPGLNAVEHPIYDVWLKGCKVKSDVPPPTDLKLPDPTPQPDPALKVTKPAETSQQPADGTTPLGTTQPGAIPQGNLGQQNPDGRQNGADSQNQNQNQNGFGTAQPDPALNPDGIYQQPLDGQQPVDGQQPPYGQQDGQLDGQGPYAPPPNNDQAPIVNGKKLTSPGLY